MNHRQHADIVVSIVEGTTLEIILERAAETLLSALLIPVPSDLRYALDKERLETFGINQSEPANWGALHIENVIRAVDDTFYVNIEEAAPGECPTLCDYVRKYLTQWGWKVVVNTNW